MDDTISLRNLLDIRDELFNLRKKWDYFLSRITNLSSALTIIQSELKNLIQSIDLDSNLGSIKCVLNDSSILFIRYNNYNEYSYNLIFSNIKYDRVRFDNFDDTWNVSTRPNHFHPRNSNGFDSL